MKNTRLDTETEIMETVSRELQIRILTLGMIMGFAYVLFTPPFASAGNPQVQKNQWVRCTTLTREMLKELFVLKKDTAVGAEKAGSQQLGSIKVKSSHDHVSDLLGHPLNDFEGSVIDENPSVDWKSIRSKNDFISLRSHMYTLEYDPSNLKKFIELFNKLNRMELPNQDVIPALTELAHGGDGDSSLVEFYSHFSLDQYKTTP